MRFRRPLAWLCAALLLAPLAACAAGALPPEVAALLRRSGLPLAHFGIDVRAVDSGASPSWFALNADRPFLLASTTKLVTSLAALDLLGRDRRWRTEAHATGALAAGRLAGDLVIVGGAVGLTAPELRRWFAQMRGEGLREIAGDIVLQDVALLDEAEPAQAAATAREQFADLPPAARVYNAGKLLVSVAPSRGARARVTLRPRPANVHVDNDVLMGGTQCAAWARWKSPAEARGGPPLQLWVRGRWGPACAGEDIAFVQPPAGVRLAPGLGAAPPAVVPVPRMVAALWAETGGRLRGRVVETDAPVAASRHAIRSTRHWSSEISTPLAEVMREMNKTSNNAAAHSLLLALASGAVPTAGTRQSADSSQPSSTLQPTGALQPTGMARSIGTSLSTGAPESIGTANSTSAAQPESAPQSEGALKPAALLRSARARMHAWLRGQGLADGDIEVVEGSGRSRAERGRPRSLVQLLCNAWRSAAAQTFIDSLPIAGVDGTLQHRMRNGAATGQAWLKTGTLSDTRALAGYVRAKSGTVYAVTAIVTDAQAAKGTPALDALIEWIARKG